MEVLEISGRVKILFLGVKTFSTESRRESGKSNEAATLFMFLSFVLVGTIFVILRQLVLFMNSNLSAGIVHE